MDGLVTLQCVAKANIFEALVVVVLVVGGLKSLPDGTWAEPLDLLLPPVTLIVLRASVAGVVVVLQGAGRNLVVFSL